MLSLWQISPLSFWLSRDFKYPPKHEDTNSVYCSQKDPKLEWSPFIKCEAKLETPCISVSLNSILCSQTYPKSCGTVPLITDYEMIKNLCCSKERKGEQVPCFATPFCSPSNQCSYEEKNHCIPPFHTLRHFANLASLRNLSWHWKKPSPSSSWYFYRIGYKKQAWSRYTASYYIQETVSLLYCTVQNPSFLNSFKCLVSNSVHLTDPLRNFVTQNLYSMIFAESCLVNPRLTLFETGFSYLTI